MTVAAPQAGAPPLAQRLLDIDRVITNARELPSAGALSEEAVR